VHSAEDVTLDWNADHRQYRLGGGHAGKMRGSAGPGDDDLESARFRRRGILEHPIRSAVRGNDAPFEWNLKLLKLIGGVLKRRPVRFAAHDDSHHWRGLSILG